MQVVPKYRELSTRQIWTYVKGCQGLMIYFPDYTESQLPDREFMFAIISTVYPKSLRELVEKAREKRSLKEDADKDELIEIDPEVLNRIMSVLTMKS